MPFFFSIPFQRWPLRHHAMIAGLIVVAVAAGGWWFARSAAATLDARGAELQLLQTQLQVLQRAVLKQAPGNFTQSLPPVSRSDEVVHEMSRHAQSMNVQISSLSIVASEPSASELRKVQFNLAMSAEYRSIKSWLAEMLSRYPSLGVQMLSMRGLPNNPLRQEVQLVLVLFVKD